jgi:hypothetical protein
MTIDVKPELAAALSALASEKGLSVEDYLQQLVEKEMPLDPSADSDVSGMIWENGLFVYRTGRPLPVAVVGDAIRQVREERSQRVSGERS